MPDSRSPVARVIRYRRPIAVVVHAVLIVVSAGIATWLRFDGDVPPEYRRFFVQAVPLLIICRLTAFLPLRLFEGLWRYTSIWDLRNIIVGVAGSSLMFYAVHFAFPLERAYSRSILLMDTVLLVCLMTGIRLSRRLYREFIQDSSGRKVIVFGAGDAGELIVRDMRQNSSYDAKPIAFIDDNPAKIGRRIHGLPVLGGRHNAERIIERYRPDEILIAVPSASPAQLRGIVRALEHSKVRLTTLPGLGHFMGRPVEVGQIRALEVQDLLRRDPVDLDPAPIRGLIGGRRVLVTGAGGSIGSEICRQVAALGPSRLVALDRYENSLFALLNTLQATNPGVAVAGVIADVTDAPRLDDVFLEHRPEIVFHAAAHKHVPLMERNPCEAVKNNVRGTRVAAEAALRHGCARFILISTDKAVNPASVMGASKRVAELVARELAARQPATAAATNFITVRFGNVLASNGSVVPVFLDQIKRGGPVTVTHPEMRRYFMLISEAVQLVLHAATLPEHGGTYALEMGEQISLIEMARDLIRLSGYVPDEEVPIEIIGLRPGEKLSEELVGDDEQIEPTSIGKILRLRPRGSHVLGARLLDAVRALETAAAEGMVASTLEQLTRLVPAFSTQGHPVRRVV